jgi:protein O-mannosyl-transferase
LRKLTIPGAFLAAMIFAVHPVNVEVVAWIAQRKDMLAFLFFLLSILWYLKHFTRAPLRVAAKQTLTTDHCPLITSSFILHPSSFWYWLSLAAFVLAMLSKGSAAMLPVVLLGIDWWKHSVSKWTFVRIVPFFLVAAALTGVHVWYQTKDTGEIIRAAGFLERLLGAGGVVWFYLYKAIVPINLIFVYPQWNIQVSSILWWAPLAAAVSVTAVLWWHRNNSWIRPLFFAWAFFCVALAPVMGFTDVFFLRYSLVADHYQHTAIIGVIVLAAAGFSTWSQQSKRAMHWAAAVAVAMVGILALLTCQQSGLYRDEISVYQVTLEKNPDAWMASYNLGCRYLQGGRPREAIGYFREALRVKDDMPDAHNNLGNALNQTGSPLEAIEQCRRALELQTNFPEAQYNLGNALLQTGRPLQAIEHYKEALQLKPDFHDVHNNLGLALAQTGRFHEAIEQYKQTLQSRPDYANAYYNLALAHASLGQSAEALAAARKALELARAQGQALLARQIEAWLNSYH